LRNARNAQQNRIADADLELIGEAIVDEDRTAVERTGDLLAIDQNRSSTPMTCTWFARAEPSGVFALPKTWRAAKTFALVFAFAFRASA
jgi:hypothetical protein